MLETILVVSFTVISLAVTACAFILNYKKGKRIASKCAKLNATCSSVHSFINDIVAVETVEKDK